MREYKILSDSSCDIDEELAKALDIRKIPYYVTFDQNTYYKENVEITKQEFYEKLLTGKIFPKTSLPSIQDYINVFTEEIQNGYDVLVFTLTAKFSGSHQSALSAKEIVEEEYPDARIEVVDSIQATGGQGMTVLEAVRMKRAGLSLDEVLEGIDRIKDTSRIMFTVDSLLYLQKGGRIGKVTALAGSMLQLKPMIVLKDKELIPYSNVRGRKKSIEKVIAMTEEYFEETKDPVNAYHFGLIGGTTPEDFEKLKEGLHKFLSERGYASVSEDGIPEYPEFFVGVTIGTYTGPGPLGITFIRKYNTGK